MLAMHYKIPLADAAATARVRARAAERGPLFDGMPGLAHKLFLVDPIDPCYATFYLWREPEAALRFLNGPFFAALSETFGRPDVLLLLTDAQDLPPGLELEVSLAIEPSVITPLSDALDAVDPRDGSIVRLGPASAPGRRFEVMFHARGTKPVAAPM